MKLCLYLCILFTNLFENLSELKSQDLIKFDNNGDTAIVHRRKFHNFSIRIPDSIDVSEAQGVAIVKLANSPNFAAMLMARYSTKKAESNILDQTIELKGKSVQWDLDKIYKFKNEELKLGNSGVAYMVNGFTPNKQPMKIYNIMGIFESIDKEQMILYVCAISVNPEHKYYNDFKEIQKFMYDFKVMMATTEFKK